MGFEGEAAAARDGARSASPPPAIEAQGICRRYGRRWALANVDLKVERGRVVMVAGRNGSGKSTLLRVLSTAIRADRGRIAILGHDVRSAADLARERIALLAHHSHLYEALTARENLEVAARFLARPVAADTIPRLLAEVGLDARADDPVSAFSAGMRKRLSLARVLLQDADVVLLDEPYAALDVQGFALVDTVIERMRARGSTVLMATHLLEHGSRHCDEAIMLEDGRLVFAGRPGDVPLRETEAGVAL